MKQILLTREDALQHAQILISSPNYTRELDARTRGWIALAEKLPSADGKPSADLAASRALENCLREARDLGIGSPKQSTETSVLAHQGYVDILLYAMQHVDKLTDADTVTQIRTETGAPFIYPWIDDTQQAAVALAENVLDTTGIKGDDSGDPYINVQVGTPTTYRSKIVRISVELVADSRFPLAEILMRSFAIRLSRGIGPALVSSLMTTAIQGPEVKGDTNANGADPTKEIGYLDLVNLKGSINPAYRRSPKCAWVMNDSTLTWIDSLVDKVGRPIIPPLYNPSTGERLLLDYPIKICPSMDDLGPGKKPVAFGALDYFIFRVADKGTDLQILKERYAEFGQVGYQARLRANGVLLGSAQESASPETFTSPVKYLQNTSE